MSDKQKSEEDNKPSTSSDEKGLKVRVKKALARFFVRRPEKKELEERNILQQAASDDRKLRAKQLELRLSTRLSKDTLEQLHILQPGPESESPPLSPTSSTKSSGVKRIRDKVNRKASQIRQFVRKNTRKDVKSHDDSDLPKKESSAANRLDAHSRRAKYSRKSRSMPAVVRSRKNNAYVFGGALPNMDMKNVACEGQLVTVPLIAAVCVEYLLPKIELEGIFRVSGNHTDIERIKRQIDKTRQYHVIAQCDNPNTVAGIFKSFFRELSEPLLTFAHYNLFVAAAAADKNSNTPNDEEARVKRAEQLKGALTRLPKENYELLLYLVSFLVKVSQVSKLNLMDSRNLSLIWGSIVLRDEHEDTTSVTALTNTSQHAAVMSLLIDHFELIFKTAKNSSAPVKPVNNNTPPSSMSATTGSTPPSSMTSTLTATVTPVNSSTLPQTFSSPAMLSTKTSVPVSAPVKTPVTGPSAPKSRGPLPAPPPRGKAATMKAPVKTGAPVKFNSVEVPSNLNSAPNNNNKPADLAVPKNSPPKTIPALGAAYPVSAEKRGTVPGDGTQTSEPKSEPLRTRAITAGHADKEAHVKSTPAPRVNNDNNQPRALATPVNSNAPTSVSGAPISIPVKTPVNNAPTSILVTPVNSGAPLSAPVKTPVNSGAPLSAPVKTPVNSGAPLSAPVKTPVKRPVVPAVTPPTAGGVKDAPLLSPPSTAPKKAPAAVPKSSLHAGSGPVSSPLHITPAQGKTPPTPPPRAKTPVMTSPKEPRRSYSLQTLN